MSEKNTVAKLSKSRGICHEIAQTEASIRLLKALNKDLDIQIDMIKRGAEISEKAYSNNIVYCVLDAHN